MMRTPTSTPSLFVVTTRSVFRHRYLVSADDAAAASAYVRESVNNPRTDDDILEWQQTHTNEHVF